MVFCRGRLSTDEHAHRMSFRIETFDLASFILVISMTEKSDANIDLGSLGCQLDFQSGALLNGFLQRKSVFVLRTLFLRLTGFDGVQHTHLVKLSNKVSNKVVTVVCRRLKTDDDAVLIDDSKRPAVAG